MRGQDLILLVALCRQEVKFDVEHLRLLSAALDPQFLCDLHSLQDLRLTEQTGAQRLDSRPAFHDAQIRNWDIYLGTNKHNSSEFN